MYIYTYIDVSRRSSLSLPHESHCHTSHVISCPSSSRQFGRVVYWRACHTGLQTRSGRCRRSLGSVAVGRSYDVADICACWECTGDAGDITLSTFERWLSSAIIRPMIQVDWGRPAMSLRTPSTTKRRALFISSESEDQSFLGIRRSVIIMKLCSLICLVTDRSNGHSLIGELGEAGHSSIYSDGLTLCHWASNDRVVH